MLNLMETLGERIRQLRKIHKLTQQQVADACGVTYQAVSQWELGATENIKLDQFLKLCAAFAIDPYVLFYPDEAERPTPSPLSTGRFRRPASS